MLKKVPNIFAQNIFLTNRALMFRAFLESIMHLLLRYLRPSWYLEIVTVNIDDTFNVQYIILLTKYFPTNQKTKWFPERPLAWSRMIAQPCSLHCLYSVLSVFPVWTLNSVLFLHTPNSLSTFEPQPQQLTSLLWSALHSALQVWLWGQWTRSRGIQATDQSHHALLVYR